MSGAATSPRHKKHRKAEAEADPEFQIAPMIDILLVLLVFFMSISSTEVLQKNSSINLPIAKDAKDKEPGKNLGQVIVNLGINPISGELSIDMDEVPYPDPAALITKLKGEATRNPQVRVVIRADKKVKYQYLRQLLDSVGKAGIGNVTFSVVDKEPEA